MGGETAQQNRSLSFYAYSPFKKDNRIISSFVVASDHIQKKNDGEVDEYQSAISKRTPASVQRAVEVPADNHEGRSLSSLTAPCSDCLPRR